MNNQVGLGECDYYHDTALEYYTIINRTQHHNTCVPLETAKASLSIGMNLWVSVVVVGTNLISMYTILYYNDVHYMAIFSDILHI